MASMTTLERVKLALRISHDMLDSEINDNISAARLELKRVGVSDSFADSETDMLIVNAVKTYCLMRMAKSIADAEGYARSWEYQLDNLRKTNSYNTEPPIEPGE